MPTTKWNKLWGKDLNKYTNSKKTRWYYGKQWGDPDKNSGLRSWILSKILLIGPGDLSKVIKNYISPYVTAETVALEIGSGGGRWTKYLLNSKEIIIVELNPEFFSYLKNRFKDNISKFNFYKTSGYELDGIKTNYVDYIFTFGTFVHIDPEGIFSYLEHIKRVLKPKAIAVIQYSDKTKIRGRMAKTFSDMNPKKMEEFVSQYSFKILENNIHLLNHSSIIVIQKI
jgi:ubiquinone/menaquinone biosynthesis C-methylase UbiE